MVVSYVGLGSNLADPRRQVEVAIAGLADLAQVRLLACSWLYATAPVGPQAQPDYVNAVVALRTCRAPRDLLAALQGIEGRHGRVREGQRWGPRTLDLDLLLYGDRTIAGPTLTVPHPEIHQRAFVLVPLADIAPGHLDIPGQGRLADLLYHCPRQGVRRLARPQRDLGAAVALPLSCC